MIGSVADGWWRDRPGAARRLAARLACLSARGGRRIVLVLDRPQPDLPEGSAGGVEVRYPHRGGRDAADRRIVELLRSEPPGAAEVVTSDRALAAEARGMGFRVSGARALLAELDGEGC